jgi:hypothetical protein
MISADRLDRASESTEGFVRVRAKPCARLNLDLDEFLWRKEEGHEMFHWPPRKRNIRVLIFCYRDLIPSFQMTRHALRRHQIPFIYRSI